MNGLTEFLKSLGPSRIVALAAVMAALLGFFGYIGMRVSEPRMALLYNDVGVEDAGKIISQLEVMNVPYEQKGDGTTIFVPEDQVLRLRINLAEMGMPAGGVVGYEIFDNADALGTTSFVQNLNRARALEGELARTIGSISGIRAARVHLVLPERELFSREKKEPTASIVLKVDGAGISRSQVKAIQHLVSSAVEGLNPNKVSIVDERGTLLATGEGDEMLGLASSAIDERNLAYETRLRKQVEDIVSSVVGEEKSRVQVVAELDFNRVTKTSDAFDPEGQVVRSTLTVEENNSSIENQNNDGVTVGNNLPNANAPAENGPTNQTTNSRTEETVNYEISRTTKTEVMEAGRIKRLSVAVLVDGSYQAANDGSTVYQPRTEAELEKIATLVRSAIGYDADRGDQVEVVNLQFAPTALPEPVEVEEPFLGLTKADYMRIGELSVMAILTILVLLTVVRPLLRRVIHGDKPKPALAAPSGNPMLTGPGDQQPLQIPDDSIEHMIDIAKVEGKVKSSSVKKVGELVASHPEESLSILRSWLHESA